MAFTIEDFRDLVRILEQKPEWRAELRRLLLTEELLALPERVERGFLELAEQPNAMMKCLAKFRADVDRAVCGVDRRDRTVPSGSESKIRRSHRHAGGAWEGHRVL